ncbi:hypothetical protein [Paraburkholderia diazotrophica]|uniref:hypothetical protein n=1 Tax=Paraburkholderia diazotrophica TaxID=667676 RepID=UPI00316C79AB
MDHAMGGTAAPAHARRSRQGETFWREMVMTWETNGLRAPLCPEERLAVSSKKFAGKIPTRLVAVGPSYPVNRAQCRMKDVLMNQVASQATCALRKLMHRDPVSACKHEWCEQHDEYKYRVQRQYTEGRRTQPVRDVAVTWRKPGAVATFFSF